MFFITIESLYEPLCRVCGNIDVGGVFSNENTPESHTEIHKSSFFACKQVNGRNGDHG